MLSRLPDPKVVAVGAADMTTEALLMVMSPWLRALVAPDTNEVVFRRTMDEVFDGLMKHFPSTGVAEGDQEDDAMGEGAEGGDIFKRAELVAVQACLFEAAAAEQV